jgi:transcription initiation factor TFIID subunit 12
MDGSGAQPPSNQQQQVPPQQQPSLIRTDQVQKLPHLTDQQKSQHTQLVRGLWEILSSRDSSSPEYQNAHLRLTQLSQNLMKGMRLFQQKVQQQQQAQAQAAAAAAQQGQQRAQATNPQSFNQLLPQIQNKVNNLQLFLPPNISKEQTQTWLPEARLRYGIALQKQEIGRARLAELKQQYNQRQSAGTLTQEDMQEMRNRQMAADKLFREGCDFLNKFKEQQETFKAQQQNQQLNRAAGAGVQGQGQGQQPVQAGGDQAGGAITGDNRPPNTPVQMHPGQAQPAPHTINSAVNAARHQAGQAAMSPATSQPGHLPPQQAQVPTPTMQAAPQNAFNQTPGQPQPQQNPPTQQQPDGVSSAGATPAQPPNPQGPPRPLSHQAAMAQAAQNYSNANQQNVAQAAANPHAHPPGYMQNRSAENTTRNINMAIPKNLNVPPPEPVAMGPSRPTLSGGPSHGAMGVMGQPAIQKHPGYVLEGEGQRVLSKKMLDILVRQVTGGGEGEGLTPDAEEVGILIFIP